MKRTRKCRQGFHIQIENVGRLNSSMGDLQVKLNKKASSQYTYTGREGDAEWMIGGSCKVLTPFQLWKHFWKICHKCWFGLGTGAQNNREG